MDIRQQVRASFLENESQYGVWRMAGAMYTKKRFEYGGFHGVNAGYTKKSCDYGAPVSPQHELPHTNQIQSDSIRLNLIELHPDI